SFERMTYTEAISTLQSSNKRFEFTPKWGSNLQSEHEKYLANEYCQAPVFITDYPKGLKPFYMRQNKGGNDVDDQKTVACTDLLVPKVGEILGGSLREERLEVLKDRIIEKRLNL